MLCGVALQPRFAAGSGKSPEEIIEETAASILARLPPKFDMLAIAEKFEIAYVCMRMLSQWAQLALADYRSGPCMYATAGMASR
jgi:hypothetical protein